MSYAARPSTSSQNRSNSGNADLTGLRRTLSRAGRKRRRKAWPLTRILAILILALTAVPVAEAIAGAGTGRSSGGCELVSIVDGDTVTLNCRGDGPQPHQIMGLQGPPVMGAACLTEAWWGLRSQIALRMRVWQAARLEFIVEPRARLAMVLVDGVPLHRTISPVPPNLCG